MNYDTTGATASGCFINTPPTVLPTPAVADFGKLKLTGQANLNGLDIVTLQTADGVLHAASYPASTLNLSQGGWTGAEFNVFGDCCAYPVFFNTGSSLNVRITTTSTSAPACSPYLYGSTAETNNLVYLPKTCAPVKGTSAISFLEDGGGDYTQSGYSFGDPHLLTLYGVHYDLQATGDFSLLEAGPDFIVQARHSPVAANVSGNTGIAVKMGGTRVAVCLPLGLEIDGAPRAFADGSAIAEGKVLISRKANVFEILGPGAASLHVEVGPVLINAHVYPGGLLSKSMRGLLGSARGQELTMNDGTLLPNSPSYKDFTKYVDSWRVQPQDSLLCNSGSVAPSIPEKPVFAGDLAPSEQERVRAICEEKGVTAKVPVLLEDCMLDVSVLGNKNWVTGAFASAPYPHTTVRPTFP